MDEVFGGFWLRVMCSVLLAVLIAAVTSITGQNACTSATGAETCTREWVPQ
jgi:hypothetical protein